MSILIKGMEMPKSCDSCRIMVFEDTNCVDELYCGCPIVFEAHPQGVGRRPDYCPLIEAPEPHGRLIDADALIDLLKEVGFGERSLFEIIAGSAVLAAIDEAPTIIPSSEEGE